MNKIQAVKILKELQRRQPVDLLATSFPRQTDFLNDPSQHIAALVSRGGGKTYAAALKLVKACIEKPFTKTLYCALTQKSAFDTISPNLIDIKERHKLEFEINNKGCKFKNGSKIIFFGLDANQKQSAMIRGQRFACAVIDETAHYDVDLEKIITDVIEPCLVTKEGTGQVIIISTPSYIRSYFAKITEHVDTDGYSLGVPGWKVHKWSTLDNPYTAKAFQELMEKKQKEFPGIEMTPGFKHEFLAEWTLADASHFCYRYTSANFFPELPISTAAYHYILGMDLGFEDPNAWVVLAYNYDSPKVYVVYAFKMNRMTLDQIIQKTAEIREMFPISSFVIDSANKQSVVDFKLRSGIPFKAAQKFDKMQHINFVNNDFIMGNVKILPGASDLIRELETLTIDRRNPLKPCEGPEANHLCDAFLYSWRESKHYTYQEKEVIEITPEQKIIQYFKDKERKMEIPWFERETEDEF